MAYKTLSLLLKVILFFGLMICFVALMIYSQFPSEKEIRGCLTTKLYQVQLCPTSGKYTRLNDISAYLQKAVVLTEDSTFWTHNGFDLQELEKSVKANVKKGQYVRGGSTISQQLVKNLFLTKEKTISRKIVEALITLQLEHALSKKEILEKYLNVVQFGKDIFGVKQAAQHYFAKSPAQLSIVESAFLTFLLPSPEKYSKSFYKKDLTPFARGRVTQIVDNLYQYNRITDDEYLAAKHELDTFLAGTPTPPASDSLEQEFDSIIEENVIPEEL